MIHVDRSDVAEPEALSKTNNDGKTETELAIEHYTDNWDGKTQFKFARYKHDQVKKALDKLFHGKCAYCESNFRHVSPEDIEHWRPKGAVILDNGDEQKPAYYWLAATWTNLLPSCIDCNRKRRQEDVRDTNNAQSGKKNLFPVQDEDHRWTSHDQLNLNGEVPLILDPCEDEPDDFFSADDEAVVQEKMPAGTLENARARVSIDVFGLNRKNLVDVRKEQFNLVLALFKDIELAILNLQHLPDGDAKNATRESLVRKLAELKKHQEPDSTYLLIKKPIIDKYIQNIGPTLQNLNIA